MGFVVAVVGRFGVGKSILCEHFMKRGVQAICVNQALLEVVSTLPNHGLWCDCLKANYSNITKKVPMLSHPKVDELVISEVKRALKESNEYVIEIPSFVELEGIVEAEAFDFIVAVDCSIRMQKHYLEKKVLPEQSFWGLLDSSLERTYYTGLATDIFLNSVTLSHLDWVSDQMLQAYRMVNACK